MRLKTNLEGAFGTPVVLNLGSRNGRDSLVGVLLMVRGRLSSSLRWWRAQARSAGVLGRTLVMVARWSLARERSGEVERVGIDEAEADEVVEEGESSSRSERTEPSRSLTVSARVRSGSSARRMSFMEGRMANLRSGRNDFQSWVM